jgi:hypothetical protein
MDNTLTYRKFILVLAYFLYSKEITPKTTDMQLRTSRPTFAIYFIVSFNS